MARVARWIADVAEAGGPNRARYGIRFRDALVGLGTFNPVDPVHRTANFGLHIERAFQGRGLGTMACAVMIEFGFYGLGLRRIEAETRADNASMINTLTRLGFTREVRRRKAYFVGGTWEDTLVFGLLAEEMIAYPPDTANRLVGGKARG